MGSATHYRQARTGNPGSRLRTLDPGRSILNGWSAKSSPLLGSPPAPVHNWSYYRPARQHIAAVTCMGLLWLNQRRPIFQPAAASVDPDISLVPATDYIHPDAGNEYATDFMSGHISTLSSTITMYILAIFPSLWIFGCDFPRPGKNKAALVPFSVPGSQCR